MEEIRCLACGELLVKTQVIEGTPFRALVKEVTAADLDYDPEAASNFIRCPKCQQKNGFEQLQHAVGAPVEMQLSRILV